MNLLHAPQGCSTEPLGDRFASWITEDLVDFAEGAVEDDQALDEILVGFGRSAAVIERHDDILDQDTEGNKVTHGAKSERQLHCE